MNSIFVDTLFIIALVNPRDQYHESALQLSQVYESYPVLMTDCVFLEVGNALARKFKKQAVDIIVKISHDYGCSSGGVLEDINERIGIFYCCQKSTEAFRDGLCESCYGVGFSET